MSILFDRLKSHPILEEISPEQSPFSYGRSEGAPYLFFNGSDLQDLMGHEIKYYQSGVLLTIKDKHKEHNNESSFMFFNNNGAKIFDLSNIKYNGYHDRKRPSTNVSLVVRDGFLHVKTLNIETNEEEEYFISTKNGNKINDVFERKDENVNSI